jgi:hypothetical protein
MSAGFSCSVALCMRDPCNTLFLHDLRVRGSGRVLAALLLGLGSQGVSSTLMVVAGSGRGWFAWLRHHQAVSKAGSQLVCVCALKTAEKRITSCRCAGYAAHTVVHM